MANIFPEQSKKRFCDDEQNRQNFWQKNQQRKIDINTNKMPGVPSQLQNSKKIQEEKANLPICAARSLIIREITKNDSTIIISETGSGKTTQVPQMVYEEKIHQNKLIAITQPRRVAAVTLSMRVSEEMNVKLGELVGYSVRFDKVASSGTKLMYLTDGMLLREALLDPHLKRYSVIILDEAHERTLHTDVMFGVVKNAQENRQTSGMPPLKIIIMSATMDVDHFSSYFNNAPVVYIEGRQFPVKVLYAMRATDYIFETMVTIFQLHRNEPAKLDILVFLTGQDEIDQVVRKCREVAKELPPTTPKLTVLPLYAALSPVMQMRALEPCNDGSRKVIIATNIAETSLTIKNMRIVIDSGKVKLRVYEATRAVDMLKVLNISKAQASQRTGRAGREAPGTCYRLYTEDTFDKFIDNTVPEVLRCNLSAVVLELVAMGITNVLAFDFMDRPKTEAVECAISQLKMLGAVEKPFESSSDLKLTPLGKQMSIFPLDPRLSRMLLAATKLNCSEEMLTIVAILSTDTFLLTPATKKEECATARRKFFAPEGDLITLFNFYRGYRHAKNEGKMKQWCNDHFVNQRLISAVDQVRGQLRDICLQNEISVVSCGQNKDSIRRALCYGLFVQCAELHPSGVGYRIVDSGMHGFIHPSSCLFQQNPSYLIFSELVFSSKLYMRDVTAVEPNFLFDAASDYFKSKHIKSDW